MKSFPYIFLYFHFYLVVLVFKTKYIFWVKLEKFWIFHNAKQPPQSLRFDTLTIVQRFVLLRVVINFKSTCVRINFQVITILVMIWNSHLWYMPWRYEALPLWWRVRNPRWSPKPQVYFHAETSIWGNVDGLKRYKIMTTRYSTILLNLM